jgi:hypothetical protein
VIDVPPLQTLVDRGGPPLVWGGVVPFAVSGVVYAIGRLSRRTVSTSYCTALCVGYLAGHVSLAAQIQDFTPTWAELRLALEKLWLPPEAIHWLPAIAVAAWVVGWSRGLPQAGRLWATLVLALAACATLRLLWGARDFLPPRALREAGFAPNAWSPGEATVWITLLALGWALVVWLGAADVPARATHAGDPGTGPPDVAGRDASPHGHSSPWRSMLLALLVTFFASVVVAASGSLVYGQYVGVLVSALAGGSLAGLVTRVAVAPQAAIELLTMLLGSQLLLACVYSDLSAWHAAALVLGWIAAVGDRAWRFGWVAGHETRVRVAVCLLSLAVVGVLIGRNLMAAASPPPEGLGGNPYLMLQ